MPLRVPCPGPVLRLFSSGVVGPVPSSPCLAWGRSTPCGRACSSGLGLRAVGAARGRPGGGRLLPGYGASGAGRFPTANRLSLRRAAGARYRLALGAGGVGLGTRHQPLSARSCKLGLRAVGAAQERPGEAPLAWVWASGIGRSPKADRASLGRAAGAHYPLPVGAGAVDVETRPLPQSARSCWLALRPVGRQEGARGGVSLAWAWGVRGRALCHTRLSVPGACGRGPLPPSFWCGGCGRGDPSPTPQRALLPAGIARCRGGTGAPVGGRLLPGVGASGAGRSLKPDRPPLGRAAGARHRLLWARGVWAWGPVTNPTALAFASLRCALWGRYEGAPGGAYLACAWGVGDRALFQVRPPVFVACGRGLLPAGFGRVGCGPGDPSPTPQRALLRAGLARCGGGMRAPGGGRRLAWCGAPGVGRSPTPDRPSLGRAAGACYPLALAAGAVAWGPVTDPTALELASRLCTLWGRQQGALGGASLAWTWGVRGWTLSHARPPVLGACGRGPLPAGYRCGGSGRGDPSPTPQGARGWVLAHARPFVLGARGWGPLPTACRCGLPARGPRLPWQLLPCRGSSCVARPSRVCGTQWPLLLGTCPCAVVLAGGVPLCRAPWLLVGAPRLVRSGRSRCSGRLSCRRGASPRPGGCRPRLYWAAARGTWRPGENRALFACRWSLPR